MNPQTVKVVVVVVMSVILVGILWGQIMGGGGGVTQGDSGSGVPEGITFEKIDFDLAELVKSIQEVEFQYSEVVGARNPMTPLIGGSQGSELVGAEDLSEYEEMNEDGSVNPIYEANRQEVKGILWSQDRPLAVVSDRRGKDSVVGVGYEFAAGIVVKEIRQDSIVLSVDFHGETLEIVRELVSAEEP